MVTYDPRESADEDAVTASDAPGSEASAVDTDAGAQASGMSERAQWLVVAVLFVSGIVAPLYLYVVGPGSFGLGFRDTYLAIPMVPAILLGAVGVWTAVRGR
jgi:hypothetical protein